MPSTLSVPSKRWAPREPWVPTPLRATLEMESMDAFVNKHLSPSLDGAYAKWLWTNRTNPMYHGPGHTRETRRKMFLKRVKEDSQEKRWKDRGGADEMMRFIWISEQKRRAENLARSAPDWAVVAEEQYEQDMPLEYDEAMVEELARLEEEELEWVLAIMAEEKQRQTLYEAHENASTLYEAAGPTNENKATAWAQGNVEHSLNQDDMMVMDAQPQANASAPDTYFDSDDDEYDMVFKELIRQELDGLNREFQAMDMQGDEEMMDT